ncbi:MAG: class I SAM-dependent methyltransferase [Chloroflexota bacterium]|nr:class I SAM-dependent methyltransferase [Chloroflexota bacterium]
MDAFVALKEGMRWMWSLGDYGEVAERLAPCADEMAAACRLGPGTTVLDVAAGNGNFAVAAARLGAEVTATDLTPRMVELGRTRTVKDAVAVEWREADAEELPFAAASFDVVASVFGAMFAPRPERVASELFRVVRPGGLVAMANYNDHGFLARFTELVAGYSRPAPVELPSPFAWGDPEEARHRFGARAASLDTYRRMAAFEFESKETALAFWQRTSPPLLALKTLAKRCLRRPATPDRTPD